MPSCCRWAVPAVAEGAMNKAALKVCGDWEGPSPVSRVHTGPQQRGRRAPGCPAVVPLCVPTARCSPAAPLSPSPLPSPFLPSQAPAHSLAPRSKSRPPFGRQAMYVCHLFLLGWCGQERVGTDTR
uniref:Uncharacterized protein n=1 Tax=Molossus molossus TaxID=27622 RepID=A0A7J8DBG4_MOLMO|nr:hypothetical protein HJG59_009311 [Molossus molossus]